MAEKSEGLAALEEATEKGYWGSEPSPAAQAETKEADQTQGGPVIVDEDRDPVSGERKDTDVHGDPIDPDDPAEPKATKTASKKA